MSAGIHPTAVVARSAEIGQGCTVGPYCVIGEDVMLGEGCVLHSHVTISGPSNIGPRNEFYPFCAIGGRSQDLKYAGEPTFLEIGEGNRFREACTVNRGTAVDSVTIIGDGGNFLAYSHIAHDCRVGNRVIFSNNGTLAGHVEVGDCAVIGGLTAVHQFCRIGAHAITGGCSKIVQDVPPYMIADGNPAEVRGINQIGLDRYGFGAEVIKAIKEAYRILYRGGLNVTQAAEAIQERLGDVAEIARLLEFIRSSQRGIVR